MNARREPNGPDPEMDQGLGGGLGVQRPVGPGLGSGDYVHRGAGDVGVPPLEWLGEVADAQAGEDEDADGIAGWLLFFGLLMFCAAAAFFGLKLIGAI